MDKLSVVRLTKDLVVKGSRGKETTLLVEGSAAVRSGPGSILFNWCEFYTEDYTFICCPVCGRSLVLGDKRVYETLVEHVELREPKEKHTVICSNQECSVFGKGFWGKYGHFYPYSYGEIDTDSLEIEGGFFLEFSMTDLPF